MPRLTIRGATALVGQALDLSEDVSIVVEDSVDLHGLNRAIVRDGVDWLRGTRRLGLKALARRMNLELPPATAETVSFKISPKLNAPGRTGSPDSALRLSITC